MDPRSRLWDNVMPIIKLHVVHNFKSTYFMLLCSGFKNVKPCWMVKLKKDEEVPIILLPQAYLIFNSPALMININLAHQAVTAATSLSAHLDFVLQYRIHIFVLYQLVHSLKACRMSLFLCVLTESFDSVLKEMFQINKPTYKVCVHCIILVQSCQIVHSLIDSYATCYDKRRERDIRSSITQIHNQYTTVTYSCHDFTFFISQVTFKP